MVALRPIALVLLTLPQNGLAQATRGGSGIELKSLHQISVDQPNRAHIESHIAVDPGDPPTCTNDPRNWETHGSAFNSDQSGEYLAHFSSTAIVPTRYPMGGDTQGLAADASGGFHAAWINGETGVMQLWHTSFSVAAGLVTDMRSRASAAASSAPVSGAASAGLEDVTRDVRFRVTDSDLDFTKQRYSITLEIENQSGVLAPGGRTSPRVVRFSFEGGVPEFPEGYLSPGFRVYGRAARP